MATNLTPNSGQTKKELTKSKIDDASHRKKLGKALAEYAQEIGREHKVDHLRITLELILMGPGMNLRLFTHDNRLTLILLHTNPDYVTGAVCQVYGALVEPKTFMVNTSPGYRYLVINLTKLSVGALVGLLFASSNPELVKTILKIFFP